MGKCVEKVFQKNSLKPTAASHSNAFWYTDTGGFLEHSPSDRNLYYKRPALQKIIPGSFGSPLYMSGTKSLFFSKDFTYLFLERGEWRETERERNIHVWLPLTCPLSRTWPETQACALTGS